MHIRYRYIYLFNYNVFSVARDVSDFHGGESEVGCLLDSYAAQSTKKNSPTFQKWLPPLSSTDFIIDAIITTRLHSSTIHKNQNSSSKSHVQFQRQCLIIEIIYFINIIIITDITNIISGDGTIHRQFPSPRTKNKRTAP